jgi:hypothetical protein
LIWQDGAHMGFEMRICPGSIGWVVVEEIAGMIVSRNEFLIIFIITNRTTIFCILRHNLYNQSTCESRKIQKD